MNYLLDTCSFIWFINGSKKIHDALIQIIKSPENTIYLSTISVWEICIKQPLKKVALTEDPITFIPEQRDSHKIESLVLNEEASLYTMKLPSIHQDPFDRILIAQAMVHHFTLITPDQQIQKYPVKTLW